MMRSKKIMVALLTCMALIAVAANGAQAALHWNIAGTSLGTGSETVTVETDNPGPTAWTLSGTTLGTTVELHGEVIHCKSCVLTGAGTLAGTFTITKAVVTKPAGCSVGNPGKAAGTITTNGLKGQVAMDGTAGSPVVFAKFSPASGTTWAELEFSGATCTLAEISIPVKGTAAGELGRTEPSGTFVSNQTGKEVSPQLLRFGSAQQTTGGAALTLATGAVTLAGTASATLSGANAGKVFGPTE
jgi:hypothetical protein